VFDSKLTAVVECSDSYASQTYLRNKTTIQIHKTIAQAALVLLTCTKFRQAKAAVTMNLSIILMRHRWM